MLFLLSLIQFSLASPLPSPTIDASTTLVGPALIEAQLPYGKEVIHALSTRDHAIAIESLERIDTSNLSGPQLGDHAFVLAWSLLRADRGAEAAKLIAKIEKSRSAPESYRWLTIGEAHLATGDHSAAADAFAHISDDSVLAPRAELQAAQAWQKAGATKQAMTIYEKMAERADPADGSEIALWALANKVGLSNPKAAPLLRRIWIHYPFSEEGRSASGALKDAHKPATKAEYGQRNVRLMELGAWKAVTTNLSGKLGDYKLGTVHGCQVHYAYGRSQFKRNQVTIASQVLIPVGKLCKDATPDLGAKAFYIAGKSLERKKEWTRAAQTYERIPKTYPEHSMADDGYALAGIAYMEAGNPTEAMAHWTAQVDEYPEGNLAGEGFWRLAWTAYQEGKPKLAIEWAERMVAEVPLTIDPTHIIAGKYWSARWRLYPDVKRPRTLNSDDSEVAKGLDLLVALCTEHPANFYSLFASNRLRELAPKKLESIPYPDPAVAAETWSVRTIFIEEPATKRALALARLGLAKDAMAELDTLGKNLTPSEMTIVTDIRSMVNPYSAHDRLHHYLLHHPPSTLGPDEDRILLQALPNHYWDIVQEVTEGYRFDPRIFHALVREESSFNKDIRSWAGARGLSQLMPGTARRVGQWLGLKVSTNQLGNPKLNLQIGSRYLEYLFKYFDNNPFLAVAAYNAGEGNVGKWKTRFGDIPTDEFVESIPFRETRGYVKRVLGTYQSYRVTRCTEKHFPDWRHTTHTTGPSRP